MNAQQIHVHTDPITGYALSGKIMLCAIIVLFVVVIFMVVLHLYVRWYLLQRRRTHDVISTNRSASDHCGLEPAVLNTLPVFLYHSQLVQKKIECAVCLSEFEEKEIVRLLPKCNHSFHIACVDMWFHSHSTCPLCRSPVEPVVIVDSGTGLDSGSDLCDTCQHDEGGRMKVLRIEVPSELTQSSPSSSRMSLKRILSMGRKSPVGGPADSDLESGPV